MKALGRFVVLRRIKEESRIIGGIEMPEDDDNDIRYYLGDVISFGDDVKGLVVGDTVRYDKNAGHGVQVGEELLYVMRLDDIVFIV